MPPFCTLHVWICLYNSHQQNGPPVKSFEMYHTSSKSVGGFCTCSIQCWLPRVGLGIFATGVTWEGGMLHERRWDNLQEAPIFRSRNDGCRFSIKPIHWRHKQTCFLRRLKLQKHNVWGILIDVYRIHGFINMIDSAYGRIHENVVYNQFMAIIQLL